MKTTTESRRIVSIWAIAMALGGCDFRPSSPPVEVDLPPVEGAPPQLGDPMEVRLVEPKADDLADLLGTLGITFYNWKYNGTECVVRLWAEAKDDRVPGPAEIVADGLFDLTGPDGRIVFVLVPPMASDAPPTAVFGTEAWDERQLKRVELTHLWYGEAGFTTDLAIREESFSMEKADGRPILVFRADRDEPGEDGRPRRESITLTVRMAVLAGDRPADGL